MPNVRFITLHLSHRCPYRQQGIPVASCHINSQDYYHPYCFGCDVPEQLVELYGLRTHRKQAVPEDSTLEGTKFVYSPIAGGQGLSWMVVDLTTGEAVTLQDYARRRSSEGMSSVWTDRARCQTLTGSPQKVGTAPQMGELKTAARSAARLRKADR